MKVRIERSIIIKLFNHFLGDTALILCVLNQKQLKAEILLSAGADVNITDKKSGRTSLFHAVEANDGNFVTLLLFCLLLGLLEFF